MRTNGDVEDGVYDWNLLNGMLIILHRPPFACDSILNLDGAGWEALVVCITLSLYIATLNW